LDRPGYLLRLGKLGGEIVVRKDDPQSRKRFTIAHELGHWVLDLHARGIAMRHAQRERWCDTFASALLMPKPWMRNQLAVGSISGLWQQIFVGPDRFGVSPEAFRLRVPETSNVSVVEAEIEDGRVRPRRQYTSRAQSQDLSWIIEGLRQVSLAVVPFRYKFSQSTQYHLFGDFVDSRKRKHLLIVVSPAEMFGKP
jgi:Zn-dependent peptidase ImmA (M78 family)